MSNFLSELRHSGNGLLIRICFIAAIGGLLFGFDTGIISGALLFIKKDFNVGSMGQEWIVAILLLGAIAGAATAGYSADKYSRKWTKVGAGCVYVIGALGCGFAQSVPMLIGFRFLLGFGVGTASFVAPMYIAECAPKRLRGGLVSFNQLLLTCGILIAYAVDLAFAGAPDGWRWMLGVGAIPGAALAIGMLTVPHTPRWLLQQGRKDEARDVLEKLRGGDPDEDVDQDIEDITSAMEEERATSFRDLIKRNIRPLLWVGIGLAVFQQFVGINTVIYYAPTIFTKTGLTSSSAINATVYVGLTNVVFTIVAVLLLDRVGRRKLLLIGTAGLTLAIIFLGVYFQMPALQQHGSEFALLALLVYIASFAIGLGPVFWLMISEIYPHGVRSKAMSVATMFNWAANFLVSVTFLTLLSSITPQGTFFLFGFLGILAFVYFTWKVPETANKSLEEIQRTLVGHDAGPTPPADASHGTQEQG